MWLEVQCLGRKNKYILYVWFTFKLSRAYSIKFLLSSRLFWQSTNYHNLLRDVFFRIELTQYYPKLKGPRRNIDKLYFVVKSGIDILFIGLPTLMRFSLILYMQRSKQVNHFEILDWNFYNPGHISTQYCCAQ